MHRIGLFVGLILVCLPAVLFSGGWDVGLTLVSGTSEFTLTLGTDDAATNGYDPGIDEAIPVAPPSGAYAYFQLDDPENPYVVMLSKDIRATGETEYLWEIRPVRWSEEGVISWGELPAGNFEITALFFAGDSLTGWEDMRELDSLVFFSGQRIYIKATDIPVEAGEPPYVLSWSPSDGSVGVLNPPVITCVVADDGAGVDIGSIQFVVNEVDVTEHLIITGTAEEYRLEYRPDEPFAPYENVGVTLNVSDLATPPNSASYSISFTVGEPIPSVEYELSLSVWSAEGTDTSFIGLILALDEAGTDMFDPGYDIVIPVMPPGDDFFACFGLSDPEYPVYTMLYRDVRGMDSFSSVWRINSLNWGDSQGVRWNPSGILEDRLLEITAYFPGETEFEWVDMSTTGEISFLPGQTVYIRTSPLFDTDPPEIADIFPPDGAVDVPVNTNISFTIIDRISGVDVSSLVVLVDGVDVTADVDITPDGTGYGFDILYDPPVDFPYLSAVSVTVDVSDLAEPPNGAVFEFSFTTGMPILEPTWVESLFVWSVPEAGDSSLFQLIFGADEAGTDGFDPGLDFPYIMEPPSGPYAFFPIEHELYTMLWRDIRSSLVYDIIWDIEMRRFPRDNRNYFSWHPEMLPETGNFAIGVIPPGETEVVEWVDMRTNSQIEFPPEYSARIHFWVEVVEHYCIAGIVSCSDGGNPVGAVVYIPEIHSSFEVGEDGAFEFCGLEEGEYTLQTHLAGYYDESLTIYLVSDTTVDIVLERIPPPTYSISGNVYLDGETDHSGTGIFLNDELAFTTGEDGYFSLEALAEGEYYIHFEHTGYIPFDTVIYLDEDTELTVTLYPEINYWDIRVNVHLPDLPGSTFVMVVLDGTDTMFLGYPAEFLFEDVIEGSHFLDIQAEMYAPYHLDFELVSDTLFQVTLSPLFGTLFGTVYLEDEEDLSGSVVRVFAEGMPPMEYITDSTGYYSFPHLFFGEYEISVGHPGFVPQDTIISFTGDTELNFYLLREVPLLNPPRNLDAISGLDARVPLFWEEPEPTSAHLLGYIIYRSNIISTDSIGYVPAAVTAYIDFDVYNFLYYQYFVVADYVEGRSDESNRVWANPRPQADEPQVLIYDFDNGATVCFDQTTGSAEALATTFDNLDIPYDMTGQDASLEEYDIFRYRAIFISTGIRDLVNDKIRPDDIERIKNFILAGGGVYWEGADVGQDYFANGSEEERWLFGLFGAEFADDGRGRMQGNVQLLYGDTDFFREPVSVAYAYRTLADMRLDEFNTVEGTDIMNSQSTPAPNVSTIRMVARDAPNLKTVLSSVYIGAISNGSGANTREYILNIIYQFLTRQYSDVPDEQAAIRELGISAFPNPFNSALNITLDVPQSGRYRLDVFDITGKKVASLLDRRSLSIGSHNIIWNAEGMPSGSYFLRLQNEVGTEKTMEVIFLK
ncbi:hypothetical protein DRQ19_01185 [bacterium]|nr:MAG: hypothetical protein DRQ19_01185 [bacterium]